MAKVVYTARAHVTGGRAHGHGRTDDGALDVQLRPPASGDAAPEGTNPEQLFAVGYAACFEGALAAVARRTGAQVEDAVIEASVSLVANNETKGFDLAVGLDVTLPAVEDAEAAVEIVRGAHAVCPYSNATRGNVPVELTANGRRVEEPAAA